MQANGFSEWFLAGSLSTVFFNREWTQINANSTCCSRFVFQPSCKKKARPLESCFLLSDLMIAVVAELSNSPFQSRRGSHYDVLSGAIVQIIRRCCCEGLLSTLPYSESCSMIPSMTLRPSSMWAFSRPRNRTVT